MVGREFPSACVPTEGGQAVPGDSFVDGDRRVVFDAAGEMQFRKKD
jgi:hypothetical protein